MQNINDIMIYENAPCEMDAALLISDKLAFSMLESILHYPCKKIITNHKSIIICYSAPPFPVWLWTANDLTEEELNQIWIYINKEFPASEGYHFNTKYSMAKYLEERSKKEGSFQWNISMNMLAYDCPKPIAPAKESDGYLMLAHLEEIDIAAEYIKEATFETEGQVLSDIESYDMARGRIEAGNLYFWTNAQDRVVSMCARQDGGENERIQLVYTASEDRGYGYAARMIYEVSCKIIQNGKVPMLYTNADYAPSNRCYQKVGYELQGSLCTITATSK